MAKILLVQGANLTFLGRREPLIYGTTTAAELDAMLQRHAKERGYGLEIFYSNIKARRSTGFIAPWTKRSTAW
jgi:3-dehydroquinate dehydratase-2